ncbi:hypothetical protein [Sphaerisporangium aureirubrum]|uniref:Outer membrane lipoprotein carrier protein LolA n=1 Tax=Sphaerisporangium aureirubrum TaxID=1544736 RepID=A0ABW1NTG4_9ACTN
MDEKEVRALLIKATEDRPPGLDLLAGMPAVTDTPGVRARRERRRIRPLVPLASLGVAAAVSVIMLALPLGQPSAQAQVAAAVDNTSQESYRIHSTSDGRVFDGAFDPVQRVGFIASAAEGAETRFVGDLLYIRQPGRAKWEVAPRADAAELPVVVAVVKFAMVDPQQALQRLRSATDVQEEGPASGEGWTGKRFTFSLTDADNAKRTEAVTGAVDVDDQGRVRRLEVNFGGSGQRNVMEFGDYGTPVTVTAPPAGDVEQPSDNYGAPSEKAPGGPARKPGAPAPEAPGTPDGKVSGTPGVKTPGVLVESGEKPVVKTP